MKVLSGVHPHGSYEGQVLFDGEECRFKDIRASERRGIVIIHQELALVPHLSIAENIFLGNEPSRRGVIDWDQALSGAARLLRRVGLDEHPGPGSVTSVSASSSWWRSPRRWPRT